MRSGSAQSFWASASVRLRVSLFLPPLALRFAVEEVRRRIQPRGVCVSGKTAMGSFSIWHWMLFIAVALLLFGGKGKISDIMGDVAKGVKSFKKGMSDDDEEKPVSTAPASAARTIENRVGVEANDVHKVG
jgi:sec-independent protein translocase protein TatA